MTANIGRETQKVYIDKFERTDRRDRRDRRHRMTSKVMQQQKFSRMSSVCERRYQEVILGSCVSLVLSVSDTSSI